jgi:hypothetical protein
MTLRPNCAVFCRNCRFSICRKILKNCGFAIYGPSHEKYLWICDCGTRPRIYALLFADFTVKSLPVPNLSMYWCEKQTAIIVKRGKPVFSGPRETHELSPLQPLMLVMIQILKRSNKVTYLPEPCFSINLITVITRIFSKGYL